MKSSRRSERRPREELGGCPLPPKMPSEERQQGEKSKKQQSGRKEENPRKEGFKGRA